MLKRLCATLLPITCIITACGADAAEKIYTKFQTELKVRSNVVAVVPRGTVLPVLSVDATNQWLWVEVFANNTHVHGWIWAQHCGVIQSSGRHYGSGSEVYETESTLPSSPSGPMVGRSDPNYNEERSAFTPEGERSLEREMRNETLHGVPYDPNNLNETMVYCTLHGCE